MVKSYFKIAFRNLEKKPLYTTINSIGLFAGISFVFLIAAFVWQEYQVNTKLKNADSQYILTSKWKDLNMGVDFATLGPLGKHLKEEYPHLVANYYRWDGITSTVSKDNKNFREGIQLGDESFLNMYGFSLMHGNAKTAFNNPYSVVITPKKAIKYFGKTDVINETVNIQNFSGDNHQFTITGVLNETFENTVTQLTKDIENGFFIAKNTATYFNRANFEAWNLPIFASFIQLQPNISVQQLQDPLNRLIKQHTSEAIQKNLVVIPQKLTNYYLNKNNGSIKLMLFTLSCVGLFIIIMAIINFINIAISHSSKRHREIGVRKVLGSKRRQLVFQFLMESFILVSISTVIACITYPFLSGWFAELVGKDLVRLSQFPNYFILIPLLFILVISFLAGFYPAFVLSSFKSIDAINGKIKIGFRNVLLRKFLLGFQYVIALIVLIAALVITQQLDAFFGKGLGYDKAYIVTASVPRDWSLEGVKNMITNRNEFSKLSSVESISLSYEIPNGNNGFQLSVYKAGENPNQSYASQGLVSDEAYLKTYQIHLVAGSYLESGETNPNTVVINEKALYTYGFKNAQEAIDQQLNVVGRTTPLIVKGVVANFHFESMQKQIKPQLFFSVYTIYNYRFLSFKLKPGNVAKSIIAIEQKWKNLMPNTSFEYKFMEDTLANLYQSELQFKKATYTSAILSLIIALLGIFGMISLNITKRLKEVGIRKVLGASITNISFLFVKEFVVIIGFSILVACPLVYLLMDKWLSNYAYRISLDLYSFIIGIILIVGITILLILFQTLKAAYTSPTKSLKTE